MPTIHWVPSFTLRIKSPWTVHMLPSKWVSIDPLHVHCRRLVQWREWTQLEGWARDLESTHANVRVARQIILPYDQSLMWDSLAQADNGPDVMD